MEIFHSRIYIGWYFICLNGFQPFLHAYIESCKCLRMIRMTPYHEKISLERLLKVVLWVWMAFIHLYSHFIPYCNLLIYNTVLYYLLLGEIIIALPPVIERCKYLPMIKMTPYHEYFSLERLVKVFLWVWMASIHLYSHLITYWNLLEGYK